MTISLAVILPPQWNLSPGRRPWQAFYAQRKFQRQPIRKQIAPGAWNFQLNLMAAAAAHLARPIGLAHYNEG
jgi:hypothetical protein